MKKFGELYGLELKFSEWYLIEGYVLCVEKLIKMCVYRRCYLCNIFFGFGKECFKCKYFCCKICLCVFFKRIEVEREESCKKCVVFIKECEVNVFIIFDWDMIVKKVVFKRFVKMGG